MCGDVGSPQFGRPKQVRRGKRLGLSTPTALVKKYIREGNSKPSPPSSFLAPAGSSIPPLVSTCSEPEFTLPSRQCLGAIQDCILWLTFCRALSLILNPFRACENDEKPVAGGGITPNDTFDREVVRRLFSRALTGWWFPLAAILFLSATTIERAQGAFIPCSQCVDGSCELVPLGPGRPGVPPGCNDNPGITNCTTTQYDDPACYSAATATPTSTPTITPTTNPGSDCNSIPACPDAPSGECGCEESCPYNCLDYVGCEWICPGGTSTPTATPTSTPTTTPTAEPTNTGVPIQAGNLIAAGAYHTCARTANTTNSGVRCWGENVEGQLGDATYADRYYPADVSGLTSGVSAIAAGSNHTCAVIHSESGAIKCWGRNDFGQLGNGNTTDSNVPVYVRNSSLNIVYGFVHVTAGADHTCGLRSDGAAYCWGRNADGQLGDGTNTQRTAPEGVLVSAVSSLSAGGESYVRRPHHRFGSVLG